MTATLNGASSTGDASQATSVIIAADVANLDGDAMRGTDSAALASVLGALTDAGSLTADTATAMAMLRNAAQETYELEHHFHPSNGERWLGLAGAQEGYAGFLLPVGATGAGTWGAWTEVLDADDTPIVAGSTHFDPHRIVLLDVPQTKEFLIIQFAWGPVAATAYGDGDFTEVDTIPEKPADGKANPIDVRVKPLPADTLLWGRAKQETAEAGDGNVEFKLGIHEYTFPWL